MDNNRLPRKHADIAKGFPRDQKCAIKQGNISADHWRKDALRGSPCKQTSVPSLSSEDNRGTTYYFAPTSSFTFREEISLANADLGENEDSSGGELVPKSTGPTRVQPVNFQAKHGGHSQPPQQPPGNTCPWVGRAKDKQKAWLGAARGAGHWGCRAVCQRRAQQDSSHAAAALAARLLPAPAISAF